MKVLLPFQDPYDHPLDHPVVSGGTEMFCKCIKDNFDTEVFQVPIENFEWSIEQKNKVARDIINRADEIGADVIISNFAQAIYCGSEIIQSHIPIMIVEHCIYPMTSCIGRWNKAIDKGHSVFFVSKWQEKKYRQIAERTRQRVLPISGYVNPSYCRIKPPLVEPIYDCGTIGRCDKNKKPFLLKDLTVDVDVSTLVITSKTQSESDLPYYEKKKHYTDVVWNEPYDKVIENISKCRTYFSTWNAETWGITSMEALSCGLPTILNCDKDGDHASEIIPASPHHFKMIPTDDGDALIDAIKSFENVDRKEIQEMTWEKHNLEGWKSQMENAISMTIDNFKNNNGTLNDYFI